MNEHHDSVTVPGHVRYSQRGISIIGLVSVAMGLIAGAAMAHAQDLGAIRKAYREVNETISKCNDAPDEPCGYYLNALTLNEQVQPWAVVGIYTSKVDFWYEQEDGEAGSEARLRKINVKTFRSNRTEDAEYLMGTAGELIYYSFKSTSEDSSSQEFQFCFAGGKLIDYEEKVSEDENAYQQWHREDQKAIRRTAGKLSDLFERTLFETSSVHNPIFLRN
jgi:hypothetical protein